MFFQNVSSYFRRAFFFVLPVFLISSNAGAQTESIYFSDLNDQHKDFEAIEMLAEMNVVEGYEVESDEGSILREYRPNTNINRAEFAKIVVESKFGPELEGIKNEYEKKDLEFSDVPKEIWYYPYVAYMSDEGYLNGYPDGTFRGEQNVNAVEALAIVLRVYGHNPDESLDPWWTGVVEKASEINVIHLDIEGAEDLVTRGQMAQIIYRVEGVKNGNLTERLGEKANFRVTLDDILNKNNVYQNLVDECKGFANCDLEGEENENSTGGKPKQDGELENNNEELTNTNQVNSEGDIVKNVRAEETMEGVLISWDGVGPKYIEENGYEGYKIYYAKKPVEAYKKEFFYFYKVGLANSGLISVFGEDAEALELSDYYFYVALYAGDEEDPEAKESEWSGGVRVNVTQQFESDTETENSESDEVSVDESEIDS